MYVTCCALVLVTNLVVVCIQASAESSDMSLLRDVQSRLQQVCIHSRVCMYVLMYVCHVCLQGICVCVCVYVCMYVMFVYRAMHSLCMYVYI